MSNDWWAQREERNKLNDEVEWPREFTAKPVPVQGETDAPGTPQPADCRCSTFHWCEPCIGRLMDQEYKATDARLQQLVARIEAYGGTLDAMQANPDSVRKFETYRGQPPDYIDTPRGRIKLTPEPGTPPSSDELLKQRKAERVQRERDRRAVLALRRFGSAAENTTTDTIEVPRANGGPMESTTPCSKCGIPWVKCSCGGYVQPPAKPADPLDVEYDGVPLRTLVEIDRKIRTEVFRLTGAPFTTAQRAAVSAHWSSQLRAKIAASKAAERNVVTYCEEDEP